MSNDNRKIKPVSFSLIDERDVKRLEHAERINPLTGKPQNFGRYIKELIDDDMRGINRHGGNLNAMPVFIETKDDDRVDDYTMEAMNGFL